MKKRNLTRTILMSSFVVISGLLFPLLIIITIISGLLPLLILIAAIILIGIVIVVFKKNVK